ncbi:MAG: hypothetical protein R2753_14480 [Chitinophagales bacterium]
MKRIQKLYHIILVVLLIGGLQSNSSAQQVSATLDTTHYLIGDWISLELKAVVSKETDVTWPIIDVNIDELEVLQRTGIDSNITKESKTYTQILTLTVFDSGFYPIPAFDFIIDGDTLSTLPQLVNVSSVALDTASLDIKPIKPPLKAPLTFMDVFWPYVAIGLLALILLAVILYFIFRKKDIQQEVKVPEIIIPAHEWAFTELTKLKTEGLWQQGDIKGYYSRLTDILRQYIELRFKQPALESTTDEILQRLRLLKLNPQLLESIQTCLSLSDLVKFAKAKPVANDHETSFNAIHEFVDKTKIEVIKEEKGL